MAEFYEHRHGYFESKKHEFLNQLINYEFLKKTLFINKISLL